MLRDTENSFIFFESILINKKVEKNLKKDEIFC